MRAVLTVFIALLHIWIAEVATSAAAQAQTEPRRLALKNGESLELHKVYFVVNCRSIMIGLPQVDILNGPADVKLSIKEGMVLPRRQNCAKEVPGGTLFINAEDVKEPIKSKLTYRLKYKTKDGDRQTSHTFIISLFP